MKDLRPHKAWFLALYAVLLLLLGLDPLMTLSREAIEKEQNDLSSAHRQLEQELKQLRDDAALAERLSRDINAGDVEKYLAPASRLQVTAKLEPLAADSRLSNFTYTLAPEQPYTDKRPDRETEGLVQSRKLSLRMKRQRTAATYGYRYFQQALPGKLRLDSIVVERLPKDSLPPPTCAWRSSRSNGWPTKAAKGKAHEKRFISLRLGFLVGIMLCCLTPWLAPATMTYERFRFSLPARRRRLNAPCNGLRLSLRR